MKRALLATLALAALVLGGSAPAAAQEYSILVTRSVSCSSVTVTATGYGLSIDSAFQLVAGNAATIAQATQNGAGVRTVTATFTGAQVGENGTAIVRTRYGGYLSAGAQQSPGSPYVAAELISYRTC